MAHLSRWVDLHSCEYATQASTLEGHSPREMKVIEGPKTSNQELSRS